MVIQHNISAINSYRNYTMNSSSLSKNLEKLSSGYRINRAADDAAGLAISEQMRQKINGLDQATSNAKDAIGLIQTEEGALTEVHSMLQRMTTLATQAANGTYNSVAKDSIQKEVSELSNEIDRIATATDYNGIKPLAEGNKAMTMQVGPTAGETLTRLPTYPLRTRRSQPSRTPSTRFPVTARTSVQSRTVSSIRSTTCRPHPRTSRQQSPESATRIWRRRSQPTRRTTFCPRQHSRCWHRQISSLSRSCSSLVNPGSFGKQQMAA